MVTFGSLAKVSSVAAQYGSQNTDNQNSRSMLMSREEQEANAVSRVMESNIIQPKNRSTGGIGLKNTNRIGLEKEGYNSLGQLGQLTAMKRSGSEILSADKMTAEKGNLLSGKNLTGPPSNTGLVGQPGGDRYSFGLDQVTTITRPVPVDRRAGLDNHTPVVTASKPNHTPTVDVIRINNAENHGLPHSDGDVIHRLRLHHPMALGMSIQLRFGLFGADTMQHRESSGSECAHPLRFKPDASVQGRGNSLQGFIPPVGISYFQRQIVRGMIGKKHAPAQVGTADHLSQFC